MSLTNLGPYVLGPEGDNLGVYQGDARVLAEAIPDESIDLIFTDPVYQNVDDYQWMAKTAARVLKPDSACLVWCSKPLAARCQIVMEQAGLGYVYTFSYVVTAKQYRLNYYHLFLWTTPCLWMQKGRSIPRVWLPDTFVSSAAPSAGHKWNKNLGVIIRWLDAFCEPGGVVLDPFTGSGSVPVVAKMLGRQYLAFEIDPKITILARERVHLTQSPLPGLISEQLSFNTEKITSEDS